eukprot:4359126-Pleurochrysis_carterae.AAC.1
MAALFFVSGAAMSAETSAEEAAVAAELRHAEHELAECEARNAALVRMVTAVQAHSDELHRKWLAERSIRKREEREEAEARAQEEAEEQELAQAEHDAKILLENAGGSRLTENMRNNSTGSGFLGFSTPMRFDDVSMRSRADEEERIDFVELLDDVLNLRIAKLVARAEARDLRQTGGTPYTSTTCSRRELERRAFRSTSTWSFVSFASFEATREHRRDEAPRALDGPSYLLDGRPSGRLYENSLSNQTRRQQLPSHTYATALAKANSTGAQCWLGLLIGLDSYLRRKVSYRALYAIAQCFYSNAQYLPRYSSVPITLSRTASMVSIIAPVPVCAPTVAHMPPTKFVKDPIMSGNSDCMLCAYISMAFGYAASA